MISRKSGVTLHYQIRKYVEDLLQEEKTSFASGNVLPPEEKISEEFNVSRGTVRRAISDLVNEGILYRIPGKGTFLSLEGGQRNEITIFSSWEFSEEEMAVFPYENLLLKGIQNALHKDGYFLSMKHFDAAELTRTLEEGVFKGKGILVLNPKRSGHPELLHRLASFNIPFVVAGANVGWGDVRCVAVDNTGGVKKAVDYLISLGHKKISYIGSFGGSLGSYDSYERFESFKAECEKNKISSEYGLILPGKKDGREEFEDIFLQWREKKDLPTALIAGGLFMYLLIIDTIKKYHVKIPEDLSLVGFDDFPSAAHLNPPLTVVRQPVYEMGKEAVCLLLDAIENNGSSGSVHTKILPTELIIRGSCTKNKRGVRRQRYMIVS